MNMRNKPISPIPGYNVDHVNIDAGMRELNACGYDDDVECIENIRMVIHHSLQLWARGEEAMSQKKATDQDFYGVDFTSWTRIIAAATAAGG